MLNKFQEQYLFASVERLEDIKKNINNFPLTQQLIDIKNNIDKTISDIKNINPRLFSYPKVAKYNTVDGKYPTAIITKDD